MRTVHKIFLLLIAMLMVCGPAPAEKSRDASSGPPSRNASSVFPSENACNPYALVTVDAGRPANYLTLAGRRCDPAAQRDDRGVEVKLAEASAATDNLRIVQFEKPVSKEQAAWMAARGIVTVGFIPDNGYIVRATGEDTREMESQQGVRWVGAYAPEYRYGRRLLQAMAGRAGKMPTISVRVFFAPYISADTAKQMVEAMGAVEAISAAGSDMVIDATLATARLAELAAQPDVLVIEYIPRIEPHSNVAADIVDAREMWDTHGFYGSGEIVAVADSGLDTGVTNSNVHLDFQDGAGNSRVLAIQDFLNDGGDDPYSGHGTFVAGAVLGNGHMSGSNPTNNHFPTNSYAGMAPKASLYFQAIGTNSPAATLYPSTDLNNLYAPAYTAGARIHLGSWGASAYGDYNINLNARSTDMYCFRNPEMLIVFSAGNDGVDTVAPLGVVDPGQISSPGLAKNVLCVGASENNRPEQSLTWGAGWPGNFPNSPIISDRVADNTNGMAAFSSRGPCTDGRIKPDIVAPGTYLASTKSHAASGAVLWGDVPGNTNYAYGGESSMSAALVAGAAATLREYLRVDRGVASPPAVLLKAALLCGAAEMSPGQYGTGSTQEVAAVPNSVEGWGRLTLGDSLYGGGSTYKMDLWTNAFTSAATFSSTITVYDTSYPLKAVLTWADMAGSPYALNDTYSWIAGGGLLNDLDLRVIDPLGVTNYPRAMNSRLDLFYYTNTTGQAYNSPVGMYEAEKCTAPDTPLTITRIFQILYDTTGAGGSYGTFIWAADGAGGAPGTVLYAATSTVAAGSAGFKYRTATLATPVTITNPTFFIGSQLLSGNIMQLRDSGIGVAGSPRTYSTWTGPWTQDNDPDMWIHACGTVSTGDHMNNVEGVIIGSPITGSYKIVVSGKNVPYTPVRYGLAVSGGLAEPVTMDQTISDFLPTNGSVFVATDAVGLSATASSGLPVSFAVGSGPGILAGGTNLSFTGAGFVSIVASQAGDSNYNPAPDVTNSFVVSRAAQAGLIFTPTSPQAFNTTNALSTSGGSGTGAVSYTVLSGPGSIVNGTNLKVTAGSGTIEIRATRAQDDMYFEACVTGTVIAAAAETAVQISLDFSSYLGGTGNDSAQAVAVAPDGCIWVCGYTYSTNFPVVNPIQAQRQASQDAFISKFSPDGSNLLFSTYLGGSGGASLAMGIAVDDDGNAYVCGYTDANNFPTLNAFQPARSGFWTDMFICKLDASGNLIYSSYLGGSMFDYAHDIAVDASGCAYVAGKAWSTDFPTVNAFQPTNMVASGYNFTLTKVAADGASLAYSTYLGGSGGGHDYPRVDVTPEGIACFGGATTSTDYPVTPNAYQPVHAGPSPTSWDGVISVFSADGLSLTYSTFLGGSEDIDQITDIVMGTNGVITVVGITQSDNFPLANEVQSAISGQPDYFVTRFTPAGDALDVSTYIGGWDWDYGQGAGVGADGSIVVIGITVSPNYPVSNAVQAVRPGGYDCGISKLSPGGNTFEYSTYLGGSGDEFGYRVALDAAGNAIFIGRTSSANFPVTNAFQAVRGGGEDGFLCRLMRVKAAQTINFPAIGSKSETNVVGLSAAATSGLEVSFAVGAGPATITGGTNLSFTGTGMVSIVAFQTGNADWNAAPGVTNMFNVWPDGTEYCASYSDDSTLESISRVRFSTIDNPSGASSYSDFTAIVTELERGNAYVITVNNATPTAGDKCAVWVDWNQDFSFDDPGEMTELFTQDWAVFTNTIVAPADALPGDARMRVVLRDSSSANDPCDTSYAFGETEDYTLWLGLMDQTITFLPIADQMAADQVGLTATASSGLPVSFAVGSGPGNIADGTNLSFTGGGEVTIVASQAGNAFWNPAPAVTNKINVYALSACEGPFAGGNQVTITNGNMGNVTNVLIGGIPAPITGSGASWVTVTVPAVGTSGVQDILIQTDTGDIILAGAYTVCARVQDIPLGAVVYADDWTWNGSPLGWRVVDTNYGGVAGIVTLQATNSIGNRAYQDGAWANQWGTCTLRTWLNGTNFHGVFSAAFSGAVVRTQVPWTLFDAGGAFVSGIVTDHVFIASRTELGGDVWANEGEVLDWFSDPATAAARRADLSPSPMNYWTRSGMRAMWSGTYYNLAAYFVQVPAGTIAYGNWTGDPLAVVPAVNIGGAAEFAVRPDGTYRLYAGPLDQTLSFPSPGAVQITTNVVVLSATASSGQDVAFSVLSGSASVAGNILTFSGTGDVLVVASQSGNAYWNPAPDATNSLTVTKAVATVTLTNLNQTYDGTARAAGYETVPAGLMVEITYDGGAGAPTNVGTYAVTGTVNDAIWQGSAVDTLTISRGDQTINFPAIGDQVTTNVIGLSATASSGLGVSFIVTDGPGSLAGGTNLTFSGAGSVSIVSLQGGDANWNAASNVTNTFNVTKAVAGVILNDLAQTYDGTPRVATATTVPAGLTVDITYDGSTIAPAAVGTYAVTGVVNEVMYQGLQTGTLVVTKAAQIISDFIPTNRAVFMVSDTAGLSATASSGNPVSFAVNGGPALITGGTNLSFTAPGIASVAAYAPGDADWDPVTTTHYYFVRDAVAEPAWGEWTQINVDGFGSANNFSAFSMAVYSNKLHVGTWNNTDGCEIWRWDGPSSNDWTQLINGGFGTAQNRGAHSMAVFNGRLYVGTANNAAGFQVWAYDGTDWSCVASNGLGAAANAWASAMTVLDGKLYVGSSWQAAVFAYDGVTWTQVNVNGFGNGNNQQVRSLAAYDGKLYAGTYNTVDHAGLYRFDGPTAVDWTLVAGGGFGGNFVEFRSLAAYNGKL
ncbi:MAG: MBG domain-containing protein, partial [Kiritimatiellae bacterium]|nr:MBG domain-containing protein [Kiritimatiellia bacterium]